MASKKKQDWEIETKFHKWLVKKFGKKLTMCEVDQIENKAAHPTVNGYCCACDYDIAVMKEKIAKAEKEGYELGLQAKRIANPKYMARIKGIEAKAKKETAEEFWKYVAHAKDIQPIWSGEIALSRAGLLDFLEKYL